MGSAQVSSGGGEGGGGEGGGGDGGGGLGGGGLGGGGEGGGGEGGGGDGGGGEGGGGDPTALPTVVRAAPMSSVTSATVVRASSFNVVRPSRPLPTVVRTASPTDAKSTRIPQSSWRPTMPVEVVRASPSSWKRRI